MRLRTWRVCVQATRFTTVLALGGLLVVVSNTVAGQGSWADVLVVAVLVHLAISLAVFARFGLTYTALMTHLGETHGRLLVCLRMRWQLDSTPRPNLPVEVGVDRWR